MTHNIMNLSFLVLVLTLTVGCGDSGTADSGGSESGTGSADGNGTETGSATGDGDGDSATGDGDGDPTTGDGDGDPTTGDGDGDPTTGDGDGDPTTGDGDGDPTTGGACADLGCSECYTCAVSDPDLCPDQKAACEANPGCVDLAACVADCGPVGDPAFEACHDTCVDGMPGEQEFKDLGACLACDTCSCPNHPEC